MQRKQIASSADQWKNVMVKKSAPAKGARWKFPAKRIGGKRMFSHFYRIFRISGSRRKKLNRKTVFFRLFCILSQAFDLISYSLLFFPFFVCCRVVVFLCWMFDCWRCGTISMINSISVIFPFKYFIPFGPLDPYIRMPEEKISFFSSSLVHFARNYSSHTHDTKRAQTKSHIKKNISVSLEKIVKMK